MYARAAWGCLLVLVVPFAAGAQQQQAAADESDQTHDRHPEFGNLTPREEYSRSVFGQATWRL